MDYVVENTYPLFPYLLSDEENALGGIRKMKQINKNSLNSSIQSKTKVKQHFEEIQCKKKNECESRTLYPEKLSFKQHVYRKN